MASNRFLEMFSHHSSDDTSSVISYTDSSDDKEKPVWKKRKINNGGVVSTNDWTAIGGVAAKALDFEAQRIKLMVLIGCQNQVCRGQSQDR